MSKTVLIGCRLPSGFVCDGSMGQAVVLNGTNTSMIPEAPGLTHVPEVEWLYLQAQYAEHAAFKAGAVFSFNSSNKVADVVAMAQDLADEKTGFEGLNPHAPAPGLKPEDTVKLAQEMNKNAGVKPAAKVPKNKQDQAAALAAATGLDS